MTIPDSGSLMDNGSLCLPCTPEEEARIVKDLTEKAESCLKEGNLYYVISNRWFSRWQRYVGEETGEYVFEELCTDEQEGSPLIKAAERPGPIDNTDIITNEGGCDGSDLQLFRMLIERSDYVLVPQAVWDKLHKWYTGGPALPRHMISLGIQKSLSVEVYPLALKVIDSRDKSETIIHISKKASLRKLYEQVSLLKGVDTEKLHIWDYFNDQKHALLAPSDQTLEEFNLQMDQSILFDVQVDEFINSGFSMDSTGNRLALVLMEPQRSSCTIAGGPSLSNSGPDYGSSLYHGPSLGSVSTDTEDAWDSVRSAPHGARGLAGLQNLGNTCFMNSALQCLVHTSPFVDYFLQDYTNEINKQNPLGMNGELAVAFGELLRKLWLSGRTAVAPRVFKGKLARFAPQFSGYNQHDSQELLAFLLDGLHEDLNRVKKKPYFETKDSYGRPDEEVANEFWSYHKARNDSIVVDVCQGQYKSTLVCPVCAKISITFDPFMYLSLPLPSTATRSMTITVFYGDGRSLPMPFTVIVPKYGYCKDLFQALSAACCLESDETLILAEVYDHKIYRYLDNGEPVDTIKDDECIVAYRLSKKQAEFPMLEICHRYVENIKPDEGTRSLTPLVTFLEGAKNGTDIELAVNRVLTPLKRKVLLSTNRSEGIKVNGHVSEATEEESTSECQMDVQDGDPFGDKDSDETYSNELSFRLCINDDWSIGGDPILKDSIVKPSKIVKVVLDWTDKDHGLYDSNYLKDLPTVYKPGFTVKKTKQEFISLFSCLDAFLKEEPLGPDDMWYCPGCKEHRQATKKLDLWRLPDIIVFHLKRFSYSRYLKNKIDTFVNFPIHNLDLSKYVKNQDPDGGSSVYELYAISNHYGGLGGGHYSAYAKLVEEDRWYHFDDAHVTPVSEGDIVTSAAYLLFYQRVKTSKPNEPTGESSVGQGFLNSEQITKFRGG